MRSIRRDVMTPTVTCHKYQCGTQAQAQGCRTSWLNSSSWTRFARSQVLLVSTPTCLMPPNFTPTNFSVGRGHRLKANSPHFWSVSNFVFRMIYRADPFVYLSLRRNLHIIYSFWQQAASATFQVFPSIFPHTWSDRQQGRWRQAPRSTAGKQAKSHRKSTRNNKHFSATPRHATPCRWIFLKFLT